MHVHVCARAAAVVDEGRSERCQLKDLSLLLANVSAASEDLPVAADGQGLADIHPKKTKNASNGRLSWLMQPDGVCRVWTTKQIFLVQRSCRSSLGLLAPCLFLQLCSAGLAGLNVGLRT